MKIRNDFVSNSSSTSFICYLDSECSMLVYEDLFDELLNETVNSDKLFEYVILDMTKLDTDLELRYLIEKCCTVDGYSSWGKDLIESLNYSHNLEFINDNMGLVSFPEFLFVYMKSDKKDFLKSIIVSFVSESTWDNNWTIGESENRFDSLRDFLKSKKMNWKISEAFV